METLASTVAGAAIKRGMDVCTDGNRVLVKTGTGIRYDISCAGRHELELGLVLFGEEQPRETTRTLVKDAEEINSILNNIIANTKPEGPEYMTSEHQFWDDIIQLRLKRVDLIEEEHEVEPDPYGVVLSEHPELSHHSVVGVSKTSDRRRAKEQRQRAQDWLERKRNS